MTLMLCASTRTDPSNANATHVTREAGIHAHVINLNFIVNVQQIVYV